MVKSPFLRGITGPGFIGEPKSKPSGEDDEDLDEPSKRVVRTSDRPRRGNPTPPQPYIPLPPVANGHHDPRPAVPGSLRYPTQTAPTPTSIYRNPQQNAQPQYTSGSGQAGRTIVAMMGGQQIMDQIALREVLPHDTGMCSLSRTKTTFLRRTRLARLFERDARQQVLWFSGPPLAPGTVHVPVQPSHSIEYLEYLAKRKRGVVDSEEAGRRKGARYALSPAGEGRQKEQDAEQDGDENLGKTWWAQGMNADQIAAGLRAVIESA